MLGVSISLVFGDNGIIKKATDASKKSKENIAIEEVAFAWNSSNMQYYNALSASASSSKEDYFNIDTLNKNLKNTGYLFDLNYVENGITTLSYERKASNEMYEMEINKGRDIEIVNYYGPSNYREFKDSNNDIVKVPIGFRISADAYERTVDNGIVIYDVENGNEFVWIPIDIENDELKITDFGLGVSASEFSESYPSEYTASISRYGGFYIGRYESAYLDGLSASSVKSYSAGTLTRGSLWNYCSFNTALEASQNTYSNNPVVESHLIYSTEWDSTLNWIGDNYATNTSSYRAGVNGIIGSGNERTKIKNIYNMSDNGREWTQEILTDDNTKAARRGGSYYHALGSGYRGYLNKNSTEDMMCFRMALIIR